MLVQAKVPHVSKELRILLRAVFKKGIFHLQVSLREEVEGKGKPAMDAVVPWQCNYSLIEIKRKQIGGRSLVDEVNHVNCCLLFVVLSLDYLGYLRYRFML